MFQVRQFRIQGNLICFSDLTTVLEGIELVQLLVHEIEQSSCFLCFVLSRDKRDSKSKFAFNSFYNYGQLENQKISQVVAYYFMLNVKQNTILELWSFRAGHIVKSLVYFLEPFLTSICLWSFYFSVAGLLCK